MRQWTKSTMNVLNRRCLENNQTKMSARSLFLCGLLGVTLASAQQKQDQPQFLQPLENHTVTQGRDVYFTCVVNNLSSYKVAWIKSDTKAILAIHTHMVAQNPRISVTHNGHNTWKLHVKEVKKSDSGTYMCQINTDPMRSLMGNLDVVIPPDIKNDNDSSEGGVAIEGGTIRLKCEVTGVPEPSVSWRREDSRNLVLRQEGGREKKDLDFPAGPCQNLNAPVVHIFTTQNYVIMLRSFDGNTLILSNVQRTDMGPYLCIASNGVPPSMSKRFIVRVHFHPLIRVSNQLVAAPIARDVIVQCYVEASPRAMNHWMRDNGEKLISNGKYAMEEMILNEYSLLMNLTIRSLEKKDFGGYICTSSNAMGKAEGGVRLQELHLPVKSTSTTSTPKQVESKPRKPVHKEKPKKYRRPTKGRKELLDDKDDDDDQDLTTLTSDMRMMTVTPTPTPFVTHMPYWIIHNDGVRASPLEALIFLLVALILLQSQ